MPLHGLKADLELIVLVLSAGIVSFFVSGAVFSNVMFTVLLVALFFLMGLHADLRFFQALRTRRKEIMLSLEGIFILAPVIAFVFSYIPGPIGKAVLVVGVSASAFGSPKIWSNISNSDGELVSFAATFSLLGSVAILPLIMQVYPLEIEMDLLLGNLPFVVVPFLVGVVSQSYETGILEDIRLHFSKLSFWLIVAITLVQARLLYVNEGLLQLSVLALSSLVFILFIIMSFGYSHLLSRMSGFYEKEARSIGYITSSKNIGVALFIAAQVSGEVILLVCLYYFVRQLTGLAITDLYRHGETRLKDRVAF
ncbi:MAG: hypothetical protein ABEJ56_00875 [Candidatus Nanohaloarchaea archaeon]